MPKSLCQDTPVYSKGRWFFKRFHFPLPRQAQMVFLESPALREHLKGQTRLLKLQEAMKLMKKGFSLNQSAEIVGISPALLCLWLKRYRRNGAEALFPKPRGSAKAKNGHQPPCSISILLKP